MSIVTRFAPSPTGLFHVGGARTALFNFLYSKKKNGQFLIRIEDTDKKRSSKNSYKIILESLNWLGIESKFLPVFQLSKINNHLKVVEFLLKSNFAYKCYCSDSRINLLRIKAFNEKKPFRYDRHCRYLPSNFKSFENRLPVIRLKSPIYGMTCIKDLVQGKVCIKNEELDDMIISRSDGIPTYILSSVIDDYQMKVSNIIRGDDHFINTFRQYYIYKFMNWSFPKFAHIPLVLDHSGRKISKRHNISNILDFRKIGFLSDAICNYLLRLGWSFGDNDILSRFCSLKFFDIKDIHKSPSRLNIKKLIFLNSFYINNEFTIKIVNLISFFLKKDLNRCISSFEKNRIFLNLIILKKRSKNLIDFSWHSYVFLFIKPKVFYFDLKKITYEIKIKIILKFFQISLSYVSVWSEFSLNFFLREFCLLNGINFINFMQILRIVLTGRFFSTSVFDIMLTLSKKCIIKRVGFFIFKFKNIKLR